MAGRILRVRDVLDRIGGVSRSTLYRWMDAGRFPRPLKLGPQAAGWRETDVDAWLESRQLSGGGE